MHSALLSGLLQGCSLTRLARHEHGGARSLTRLRFAEPTSGLDSTTAMNLVASLCQLAAGGRSVITTIHQV